MAENFQFPNRGPFKDIAQCNDISELSDIAQDGLGYAGAGTAMAVIGGAIAAGGRVELNLHMIDNPTLRQVSEVSLELGSNVAVIGIVTGSAYMSIKGVARWWTAHKKIRSLNAAGGEGSGQ